MLLKLLHSLLRELRLVLYYVIVVLLVLIIFQSIVCWKLVGRWERRQRGGGGLDNRPTSFSFFLFNYVRGTHTSRCAVLRAEDVRPWQKPGPVSYVSVDYF
jgi:hypothetical protein